MIINVLGQTITPFVTAFVASLMLWKDRGFSANPHITSKKAQFQLLYISVLREYLAVEFASLQNTLPFAYDLERVIDDFVFICFFVGNDFLPHLPTLDIRDGALDFLINAYKRTLPEAGGYLSKQGGHIDTERLRPLLRQHQPHPDAG